MTSPRRPTELAELEDLVHDLENLHEALPVLIFIAKMSLAQARARTEEDDLALLGDRRGARGPALKRREAEG